MARDPALAWLRPRKVLNLVEEALGFIGICSRIEKPSVTLGFGGNRFVYPLVQPPNRQVFPFYGRIDRKLPEVCDWEIMLLLCGLLRHNKNKILRREPRNYPSF